MLMVQILPPLPSWLVVLWVRTPTTSLLSSTPSAASVIWPTFLGILSEGVPSWVTLLLPALSITFMLAIWNEAATNQHLWWTFQSYPQFPFFLPMASSFWGLLLFWRITEKYSLFMCILERGDREFKEVIREQVCTIFPSANGLDNVESLKMSIDTGIINHVETKWKFRLCLPLNYTNFYECNIATFSYYLGFESRSWCCTGSFKTIWKRGGTHDCQSKLH